jgi:hypothetical protein
LGKEQFVSLWPVDELVVFMGQSLAQNDQEAAPLPEQNAGKVLPSARN